MFGMSTRMDRNSLTRGHTPVYPCLESRVRFSRARQAHDPVWLAAANGNESGLRGGPVPFAELVPDRECHCGEPSKIAIN